ncbi:MAG: hypothetical protein Q8L86_10160 [Vicinamibacterales bacterium]|nr:hypothetical protein [Vicinamibacterales bacterium]
MSRSGWIQTYTGRQVFPLAPRREDIAIEDIAHALALSNRFTGHTRLAYSVAQHSVHVSQLVPVEDALWGLLHDASEAYLVDVPSPLKRLAPFAGYRACEAHLQRVIYHRFGLCGPQPASVHEADRRMLAAEAQDLLGPLHPDWPESCRGMRGRPSFRVVPWSAEEAERAFLRRFAGLYRASDEGGVGGRVAVESGGVVG